MSLPKPPPRPDQPHSGALAWMLQHRVVTLLVGFVILALAGAAFGDEPGSPQASGGASPSEAATGGTPGPPATTSAEVPQVEGESMTQAVSALEALGFEVQIVEKYSRVEANSVLKLSEDPGTTLEEGATLTLVVAEPIPRLPNLVGKSSSNAVSRLKDAGYVVRVVRQGSIQLAGSVISSPPGGGLSIDPWQDGHRHRRQAQARARA